MSRTTSTPETIDTRNLAEFLCILTVLTLGFTGVTHVTDIDLVAVGPLYMFTPGIAGLIVCLHNGIALSDVGLVIGRKRWLALAAILPLPILSAITALSIGVPGVTFDSSLDIAVEVGLPSGVFWALIAWGIVVVIGATFNAIFGFGEEFGWRGYLLWELAPLGFWKASLVIGAVWGVWHAPLILVGHNYPSFPIIGVGAFALTCIALAPLFTYIVIRSQSVFPAAIFHGVFNAVGLVGYAATDDAVLRQLVASEGGVIGMVVFAFIAFMIAITGSPRLTRNFARGRYPISTGSAVGETNSVRETQLPKDQ
ncbi:CPBP family intramembrane glutamic endopeptidase [Natronosalvus halobius]|uniref:CPBP family intramembrane glutamic endopeptidase n=1 Tax=Natronosalvus halobius TaxID=2953746 RepID=UPI0020A022BF|nr:CPBP family intramembrane glutamic endopeptidase [Natronosalvus halobius]USZ70431.1 CPBP family intramembrane metalloprotease [Natronosalvus halobius]